MVTRRKKALVVAAVVGTLLLAGTILPAWQAASEAWSGRRTLDVNVHVIGAEDSRPIADALITVYDHPLGPHEGQLPKLSRRVFGLRHYVTAADGVCRFEHAPQFGGGRLGNLASGAAGTPDTWIKVSAAGRQSAFVPLANRPDGPRQVGDESSIVVNVALKPGSD